MCADIQQSHGEKSTKQHSETLTFNRPLNTRKQHGCRSFLRLEALVLLVYALTEHQKVTPDLWGFAKVILDHTVVPAVKI